LTTPIDEGPEGRPQSAPQWPAPVRRPSPLLRSRLVPALALVVVLVAGGAALWSANPGERGGSTCTVNLTGTGLNATAAGSGAESFCHQMTTDPVAEWARAEAAPGQVVCTVTMGDTSYTVRNTPPDQNGLGDLMCRDLRNPPSPSPSAR